MAARGRLARRWTLIAAIALTPAPAASDRGGFGSVCVAPRPAASERSLATQTGTVGDARYSVTIDGGPEVLLSEGTAAWVRGLDPFTPHSVVILADGRQAESFFFRFEAGEPELCLFLSPYYMAWQLWPLARTGAWCSCAEEAPPPQASSNSAS
jgi:hypothetical protein